MDNASLLREHGINILTGEADKYGLRVLCDINSDGLDVLAEYFGFAPKCPKNWNSEVNGQPAIGSFMLPRDAIPNLAKFIWFHYRNAFALIEMWNGYVAMTSDQADEYSRLNIDVVRNCNYRPNNIIGSSRNTHAMSDRLT